MRHLILIILAALLSGCAGLNAVEQQGIQITVDDLQAALTAAQAAKDPGAPYRARCYATLVKFVSTLPAQQAPAPQIKGVLSAYEAAAELDATVRSAGATTIPADVHADCAVLVTSTEQFLLRLGKMGAGYAGIPGVGALPTP